MKIQDVMSSPVATCAPDDSVAAALEKLWEHDCGALPVVADGRLVGVVTDRDMAMALVLGARTPRQLPVSDVVHGRLHTCAPDQEVAAGLTLMAEQKVRRLPVVEDGRLVGMVSMNDLFRAARAHRGAAGHPTYGDLVKAYRQTCVAGDPES